MHELTQQQLIPLDKSWTIRMGTLDLLHGKDTTQRLLEQHPLGTDLKALKTALEQWNTSDTINVGESGTLYRFLQYTAWKQGKHKTFIKEGTLINRAITYNPKITTYPLGKLLMLDHGTSQWASAALLNGATGILPNPPYHFLMTQEALQHWNTRHAEHKPWELRYDQTILTQAEAFLHQLQTGSIQFIPQQQEDYCYARAFDLITPEEGLTQWPSLQGHESNRIQEMEEALNQAAQGMPVTSTDHRIIQALAMKYAAEHKPITFSNPEAVNKTWPQFWNFLTYAHHQ